MIQRLLANRWPVIAVLSDESVTKWEARALDLQSEQWELLEELAHPLELLETATVFFSMHGVQCFLFIHVHYTRSCTLY